MSDIHVLLRKSIYLVGPHSTGKTTLAKALQGHFLTHSSSPVPVPLLQETARKVLLQKGFTRDDIDSPRCFDMQKEILLAQFQAEQDIHSRSKVIISDRAGVDPILYTMKYSSCTEDWKRLCAMEEWTLLRKRYRDRKRSLVVLVKPCPQFLVDDGTRKMPLDWEEWETFGELFEQFLVREKIPFKIIGEECLEIEERVRNVVEWAC